MRSRMWQEALEASEKVAGFLGQDEEVYAKLGERLRALNPSVMGTIARGSSDHAATFASYLIPQCTGRVVASLPPSLTTVLDAPLKLSGQFVLSISQSGGSPDILRAQERARAGGALTAALVNVADSPLGKAAEILLPQRAGEEKSITATKSVLCTLAGISRIAAHWAQDQALLKGLRELPALLRAAAEESERSAPELLSKVSHAFVISRGLGYGAASELALKFKETCGLHAEAFSAAEVRHGPREIVNKDYLVLALAFPGSGEKDVLNAAAELRAQGARVLVVGRKEEGAAFALPGGGDFRLAPLLALQMLYPWIARSAEAMGRNPDKPATLAGKVIQTI